MNASRTQDSSAVNESIGNEEIQKFLSMRVETIKVQLKAKLSAQPTAIDYLNFDRSIDPQH